MTWISEYLYEAHEGWAAPVLSNGRVIEGSSNATGVFDSAGNHFPWTDVVGYAPACTCGWVDRGQTSHRGGSAISPDEDAWEACHRAWLTHIDPLEALERLPEVTAAAHAATQELTRIVVAARSGGASWEAIGRKVGMTRQAAHERWAKAEKAHSDLQQLRRR